jgi:hypothetical protein
MRNLDPLKTLQRRPAIPGDPSVPWEAKLLGPELVQPSSQQMVTVEVSAPVVLDRQDVWMGYGNAWETARWEGEAGQTRIAKALLGRGALKSTKRAETLYVRVRSGQEMPVLEAGTIRMAGVQARRTRGSSEWKFR